MSHSDIEQELRGYWIQERSRPWLPFIPGKRSIVIEGTPSLWVRFVCWAICGWKWHQLSPDDTGS